MIFRVNAKEFANAIRPAVEVATNNAIKEFKYENLLTLRADKDKLVIFAFSGIASLIAPISNDNFSELEYECEDEGKATVHALDLLNAFNKIPPEKVEISIETGRLKVILISAKKSKKKSKSYRTMPLHTEIVKPPNVGKDCDEELVVNREVFLKGLNRVLFAPAVDAKRHNYMCVLFEVYGGKKQTMRFSAGHGGRFAIKSIDSESKNKVVVKGKEAKILFPKANINSISKVLSEATKEEITIKLIEHDPKAHIPKQIMLQFDDMVMCIFGLEYFTKYPDLTKIINNKYPNRIYSNLEDWDYAISGVDMTLRDYKDDIHNTEVLFVIEDNLFSVTPQTSNPCPTTVNVVDEKDCSNIIKGDKIWFKCNSEYLKEIISQGGRSGKIQLNFESQSILDDIPDDEPKQMRPVLIKFPEEVDEAKETKENFFMFFTVSTK